MILCLCLFPHISISFAFVGLTFCNHAYGGGLYIKNIQNFVGVGMLHMCTFDVDSITQNNGYMQLLATLCMFLPLLRDLHQMSSECFMKPAVERNFWGVKVALPLALSYKNFTG